jgi:TolB protein
MIRLAGTAVLFHTMTHSGPEIDRDPPHAAQPAPVRKRGRRSAAIAGIAVLALATGVVAVAVLSRPPGGELGGVGTTTAPVGSDAVAVTPSAAIAGTATPVTPSPSATPWVPGPPGRIALVTPDGSVAVIDDTTGATTQVALDGSVALPPAWSPDGSRIAAIVSAPAATRLEVVPPSGAASVLYESADDTPFYLQWAPGGARIGFLANDAASSIALRIAKADGSAASDGPKGDGVLRRGAPLYFAWPAVDRLVLHVGTGAQAFTGTVDLGGKQVGAAMPGSGDFQVAAAGRDAVAYVTGGNEPAIVVAGADGSARARMAAFGPAAIAFDPGGSRLAAIASVEPVDASQGFPLGPLRVLDPSTGDVRTLVDDGAFAFFWSPDGTTVAVLRLESAGGGSSAERGGVRLAATEPSPSPSGRLEVHAVFVNASDGTVRSDRVVQLGEAYVRNVLPYFDQYALSHPVWSPDSQAVVLPLDDATGQTMATVLDADGGDPRPIAEAVYATWSR